MRCIITEILGLPLAALVKAASVQGSLVGTHLHDRVPPVIRLQDKGGEVMAATF
ncbi:hypothetical protein ABZ922_42080 [Streptomyces shenzhenensis]|uniref:hypothetical protein n=1 Tax=Streptomyces shenzhenensis TaxID=943815 RepID=UPI0033C5112A